jgi:hypothetical protein
VNYGMTIAMRALVVEDDPKIASFVVKGLTAYPNNPAAR